MAILRFKTLEDVDKFEKAGKGITWQFNPDKIYYNKIMKFRIKVPFPHGVYRFKTFEDAEVWEKEWWVKNGVAKRIS